MISSAIMYAHEHAHMQMQNIPFKHYKHSMHFRGPNPSNFELYEQIVSKTQQAGVTDYSFLLSSLLVRLPKTTNRCHLQLVAASTCLALVAYPLLKLWIFSGYMVNQSPPSRLVWIVMLLPCWLENASKRLFQLRGDLALSVVRAMGDGLRWNGYEPIIYI